MQYLMDQYHNYFANFFYLLQVCPDIVISTKTEVFNGNDEIK